MTALIKQKFVTRIRALLKEKIKECKKDNPKAKKEQNYWEDLIIKNIRKELK